MLAAELKAHHDRAQASGRANVTTCLAHWGIERGPFEVLIDRLSEAAGPIYYVSTVPRGQAGSTSDLDVIVVSNSDEAPSMSNMLFHMGRRVGAKVAPRPLIEKSIGILADAVRQSEPPLSGDPRAVRARLPIKWVDLERLVNGVSFAEDNAFLSALPVLSVCQQQISLEDYVRHRAALRLACGVHGGSNAYLSLALMAAMDAVMAACGRVQSNAKWTFVRWARFLEECTQRSLIERLAPINSVWSVLERSKQCPPEMLDAVDHLLEGLFGNIPDDAGSIALVDGVHMSQFLPGAICIG
ncbi:MAG: DUF6001 family protein, partial [bacterium]